VSLLQQCEKSPMTEDEMQRKRKLPIGERPRGPCPVCHQGFRPATDAQWEYRWGNHIRFSKRHKKYLEIASRRAGT
jgi:hypothetical protein